jgi:hypothetical protein
MKTEQINEGKEEEAWMAYRDAAQRHGLRAGVAAASLLFEDQEARLTRDQVCGKSLHCHTP